MSYTFPITKEMVCAKSTLSISGKSACKICKAINSKKYVKARKVVEGLAEENKSLKGKYYTKAAKEILKLLNSLESNAKAKNMDIEGMKLLISAHMGPKLFRMRRKWRFGKQMKVCHVHAVLKK